MDGWTTALYVFAVFLAVRTLLDLMRAYERELRRKLARDAARKAADDAARMAA